MSDEDSFARALGRITSAQVAYAVAERVYERGGPAGPALSAAGKGKRGPRTAGTVSATTAVTDALSELLGSFVSELGARARRRAELAGRTRCALPDVLSALEHASRTARVGTRDLAQYASYETMSFPHRVPSFPVAAPPALGKRLREPDADPGDVPGSEPWMPPLPPAHTYVATAPTGGGAAGSTRRASRADLADQRRQVEESLARLTRAREQPPPEVARNPFLRPPRVGEARGPARDPAEPRTPPEPVPDDDAELRDSNVRAHRPSGESEAKRARVERILAESAGVAATASSNAGVVGASKEKPKEKTKEKAKDKPKDKPKAAAGTAAPAVAPIDLVPLKPANGKPAPPQN